jgi:hypothetical protein
MRRTTRKDRQGRRQSNCSNPHEPPHWFRASSVAPQAFRLVELAFISSLRRRMSRGEDAVVIRLCPRCEQDGMYAKYGVLVCTLLSARAITRYLPPGPRISGCPARLGGHVTAEPNGYRTSRRRTPRAWPGSVGTRGERRKTQVNRNSRGPR